jgi:hypothetical protein
MQTAATKKKNRTLLNERSLKCFKKYIFPLKNVQKISTVKPISDIHSKYSMCSDIHTMYCVRRDARYKVEEARSFLKH